MKKTVIAAGAMLVAASAFASSIAVPFFVDWAAIGSRGFIGLKNNTSQNIEISIFYRDNLGQNRTPGSILGNLGADFVTNQGNPVPAGSYNSDPDNTYVLQANAAIAFRPAADGGGEGAGGAVPNMMGFQVIDATPGAGFPAIPGQGEFPPWNGSAEIRWQTVGGERDIQGRYFQDAGAQNGPQSAYLLPPGLSN